MYGDKYGTPNDVAVESIQALTRSPIDIPKKPAIAPKKIYTHRRIRKVRFNEKFATAKELIPVRATIITKIGLTTLALTIACPKINVPTIPSVGPHRSWGS